MKVMGDQLVATAGVSARMTKDMIFNSFVRDALKKFMAHDWGQTASDSVEMNNEAIKEGNQDQIFAVYKMVNVATGEETTIWIITEYDNSVTTILFPEDY